MQKINVGILFGGQSTEHEISLLSAKNIVEAIDDTQYRPVLIYIDRAGTWYRHSNRIELCNADDARNVAVTNPGRRILFSQNANDHRLVCAADGSTLDRVDVLFPVLHGIFGEDGSIQGLSKLANIPCVGSGIMSSSVGMDKDITKRLLRDSGIEIADFVCLKRSCNDALSYDFLVERLGPELFVKPANLGSSVGVSFVDNAEDFERAVRFAFRYDQKVIVEERIVGRELECAVLGNGNPKASVVGEVIPKSVWYSFENKYIDDDGARLEIPAVLDRRQSDYIRSKAIEVYRLLDCQGMARIDFFLKTDGSVVVNEINTIPGFTEISMYPKLWLYSGVSYKVLIGQLIELAIEAYRDYNKLIK